MTGYCNKDFLLKKRKTYKEKSDFLHGKALRMTKMILKNNKEKPLRSIKTFFQKKLKEDILKELKDVLLNEIKLYDGKSKIIKLFEDKNIKPSNFPHNAKSKPEPKYEPKFEETIADKIKRRKKIKDEIAEDNKSINIELFLKN